VPHDEDLNLGGGNFTLSLWVNIDTYDHPSAQVMMQKMDFLPDGSWNNGWTFWIRNHFLELVTVDETILYEVDTPINVVTAGEWTHLAVRRTGKKVAIVKNGLQLPLNKDTSPLNIDTDAALLFGSYRGTQEFLIGRMDELQIFAGRALSDAEIASIYNAGSDGICAPVAACGNARRDVGEECDDGNLTDGDGCQSDCTLSCGNGTLDPVEECDDSNMTDGDGCDSNCRLTACGNGVLTGITGEACDDGNVTSGDGCDSNCTPTVCGNAVTSISTGERCDDGNLVDGDGCESDCTRTPVDVMVPPGGTATTDPGGNGATPAYPQQVSIRTTTGGQVTIEDTTDTVIVDGVQTLGIAVQIEAPAESTASPLVITLTIDASLLPPQVDVTQFQALRDGVPLADCQHPTAAEPDPCLSDLTVLPGGDIELVARTSHASLWQVGLRGLNKGELGCVKAMHGAGIKLAKLQAKAAATCLKRAAKGEEPDPQACLTADTSGKIASALAKTLTADSKKCGAVPPFAYAGGTAVNSVAPSVALDVVADVFGSDLTAAVAAAGGEDDSKCQAAVLKGAQKLTETRQKLFLTCAKGALSGKTSLAVSGLQLAECFAAVEADPEGKLQKVLNKLESALASTCTGVTLPTMFPVECFTREYPVRCLDKRNKCRSCGMFDGLDDLGFDCDSFDDGVVNASCG
jgi:cysteine-rich repeat protein